MSITGALSPALWLGSLVTAQSNVDGEHTHPSVPRYPFHWLLIHLLTRTGVGGEVKAMIILFFFQLFFNMVCAEGCG